MAEENRKVQAAAAHQRIHAVNTTPPSEPPDLGTRSMLEGLATLHPLVMAIDAERRVIWLSDELDLVSGNITDLIGRPLATLLRAVRSDDLEVSKPQTLAFVDEMKKHDKVVRARFDLCRKGSDLPLEVSAFCVRDAEMNRLFVCIADRHEPRESLEQKNDELEACVQGVAHDLRSPLVSLLGFAGLLRDHYGDVLDQRGQHFLSRIDQAARHMDELLHDMLELSRLGATSQFRVPVNPAPILDQLRSELKIQLDEKGIALKLPEDPPTLLFDRTRLYQLFSNLIGNAIQHMDRDFGARIRVEIESVSDGWQIQIIDNGPGIKPEDQTRIFGVFEIASRVSGERRNSGLGLAIVKKIVELHSGRVWVESTPGEGSQFFVWLPGNERPANSKTVRQASF
ncbi:MAG: HAMP domain-containing sensor histidine kinase [Myxococcales bacterium]|nr:HAMP domain-containing histidine kinase [Myxococcales bacterium]HIK85642.1 HAMP domain-containing histidine kinase [Myxococcales bacterium]